MLLDSSIVHFIYRIKVNFLTLLVLFAPYPY